AARTSICPPIRPPVHRRDHRSQSPTKVRRPACTEFRRKGLSPLGHTHQPMCHVGDRRSIGLSTEDGEPLTSWERPSGTIAQNGLGTETDAPWCLPLAGAYGCADRIIYCLGNILSKVRHTT